jgi:ferrous iron transport protein A
MTMSLADVREGVPVRIAALGFEGDVASWLAAVGLHEGEDLVVLRRAIFGGPIHVRTGAGGEFAVARELAAKITITNVTVEAAE